MTDFNWENTVKLYFYGQLSDVIELEQLYQAFKIRLVSELVARDDITHDVCRELPLDEKSE